MDTTDTRGHQELAPRTSLGAESSGPERVHDADSRTGAEKGTQWWRGGCRVSHRLRCLLPPMDTTTTTSADAATVATSFACGRWAETMTLILVVLVYIVFYSAFTE